MTRKAVFTIVSKNYLHFARTLMQSVAQQQPDWSRYVLLVDRISGEFDPAKECFETVEVEQLPLPDPHRFFFRYTILELNTAVKPWMIEWLFESRGFEQVVYIDPDIFVYRPLVEVEAALDANAMAVLTPHLTGQLDDDRRPSELDILRAGTYNLGFIALRTHRRTAEFVRWWQSKLEYQCVVDFEKGIFVDQKWIDLVPSMFDDVRVLKHAGYNVAYWNLKHRSVQRAQQRWTVNGEPLTFFHFSGINAHDPRPFSKHQDRYTLDTLGPVAELAQDYCKRLIDNGLDDFAKLHYAFGQFTDGSPIPDLVRWIYRETPRLQALAGADPFAALEAFNAPFHEHDNALPVITHLMKRIWDLRPDLQRAHPDPFGADRARFAHWFATSAAHEYRLPARLTQLSPAAAAAAEALAVEPADAEFIADAYRVLLRRPPDASGLSHYGRLLRAGHHEDEVIASLLSSREGLGHYLSGMRSLLGRRLGRRSARGLVAEAPQQAGESSPIEPVAPAAAASSAAAQQNKSGRPAQPDWHLPVGVDFDGFYVAEKQPGEIAVWMGPRARLFVHPYRPGSLRVVGEHPLELHRRSGQTEDTRVSVLVNGQPAAAFSLPQSGPFDVAVSLSARTDRDAAVVELRPSSSFVPARLGLNGDDRALSLRIARIELDGRPIVDFSAADPVVESVGLPVPGLNVVGYVRSEHGLGQSPRLFATAAEAAGLEFCLVDFNSGNAARTQDDSWSHRIGPQAPHPVNVLHVNADQMPLAHSVLGAQFFEHKYNVGFWHWELPEMPREFMSGFAGLDEVWAPTAFVVDAVSARSPVPVVRMPHAVRFDVDPTVRRGKFRLPESKFLFLTMYDLHSYQERKNPQAVVRAFHAAFPSRTDVCLVIKTQNSASFADEFAQLCELVGDAPNILVLDRTLLRSEVYELESLCDCFVSLHRSEGFGLGLAESMYLGKPVVGTNWSGNVDFMNNMNSFPVDYSLKRIERDVGIYRAGQYWADPDEDHAAWLMRKLVEDQPWRELVAQRGQRTIREDFSPERVGALYRRRLDLIGRILAG